jgi:undecaprenyl diphosphate synthase
MSLDHVMIVGGGPNEWSDATVEHWGERVGRLGSAVADAGGRWLTIRPYGWPVEVGPRAVTELRPRWMLATDDERCTVIVDSTIDGRAGFARSVAAIPGGAEVDEKRIAEALYTPADCEPDLIVILGRRDHLPPSLVWELAYGELVYTDRPFAVLDEGDVAAALDVFRTRDRRFGGLSPS